MKAVLLPLVCCALLRAWALLCAFIECQRPPDPPAQSGNSSITDARGIHLDGHNPWRPL